MRKRATTSRYRSEQRHSAGYQKAEGRIFYRFHPRHGLSVSIEGRNRHQGAEVFVIRQPDGIFAWVPCWMMSAAAAEHTICSAPRLPLECLRDLRLELDSLLSWVRCDSTGEDEHDAAQTRRPTARPVRNRAKRPLSFAISTSIG